MTDRHEVVVDTAIYEAWIALNAAVRLHNAALASLEREEDRAAARVAPPTEWTERELDRLAEVVEERRADAEAAGNALAEAETAYEGWSRFFLVTNTNGHIHSSLSCSTCYITTEYAWLPELSGLTEADAVDEYGGILCSVCFPSAPSDWTNGENKKDAEAKALAAAWREIARSPEGKKVKTATELVSRKEYKLSSIDGKIERFERDEKAIADGVMDEHVPFVVRDYESAVADKPKTERELDRARIKLAAAEAALNEALES